MNFHDEYKKLIERRKQIIGDVDYDNDPVIKEMIRLMTEDMHLTIAFLKEACSEEQFVWLSEIADEITACSKSPAFIRELRELCRKYPEAAEKYNIQFFVDSAAEYLE